ncbi:hypothetical protein MAPG_11881 [Magnaporthiopsis poae ATCC 64411]|uniref:Uncharacterized protein n=1 Tax=Magnaporthiopsis poae (strain ATCC 64411 / 73-15) TaxID=644358 RepID=A0A0C4EGE4_MAGP6|nr:hypothetical protein MAPG_11881 [Magnaporthiopsis poae ATCC 64411]
MGVFFYALFGAAPASAVLYYACQPGADGQPSSLTQAIERFSDFRSEWEKRNILHTQAIEQAAHDKNLFYNVQRNTHVELKFPEYVTLPCSLCPSLSWLGYIRTECEMRLFVIPLRHHQHWLTAWLVRHRAFQTGSPFNVPAGHYGNMDKVVAHYKQQHVEEEERKAKKLAAKQSE